MTEILDNCQHYWPTFAWHDDNGNSSAFASSNANNLFDFSAKISDRNYCNKPSSAQTKQKPVKLFNFQVFFFWRANFYFWERIVCVFFFAVVYFIHCLL